MAPKGTVPPKFAVLAADVALFTYFEGRLRVRLIDCANTADFPNQKCLPGGLIHVDENSDQAARRILKDKAGVSTSRLYLSQFKTYSDIGRDPRGRVVAVGYVGLINANHIAREDLLQYVPVGEARHLAYDHDLILSDAKAHLQDLVMHTNVLFEIVSSEFTVLELKEAWQAVMGKGADKRNFLKKLKATKAIRDTHKKRKEGAHRPAILFEHPYKGVVKKSFF